MDFTVLLRRENGHYTARVPALPECVAVGQTREDAIENVRIAIGTALADVEVVTVNPDTATPEEPADDDADAYEGGAQILTWDQVMEMLAEHRAEEPSGPPPPLNPPLTDEERARMARNGFTEEDVARDPGLRHAGVFADDPDLMPMMRKVFRESRGREMPE